MRQQSSIVFGIGETGTTPRNDFPLMMNRFANTSIDSFVNFKKEKDNYSNLISPIPNGIDGPSRSPDKRGRSI